jgi:AAA family ATP:ADP antiporter
LRDSRPLKALAVLLNIRPGDGLPLCILLAHSFLKGVARVFFETPANTIFLVKFSAGSLPGVYIGTAVVSILFGLAYAKLEERISARKLLTVTLIFLTVVTALLYFLLRISVSRPLAMSAMIFKDVHFALIGIEFWALAGLLMDVRQAKRLFGLVTAGEILAGILSGFSIPWIVARAGPLILLLISSLATAASIFLLLYTFHLFRDRQDFPQEEDESDKPDSQPIWQMFRDRYLAIFFGISVLSFFVEYFVEYAFYGQVETAYPNEVRLASFFGIFYGLLGVGQLVSSTSLAGPMLTRFGLSFGLLLLPVTNISMVGLAALAGSFRAAAAVFLFLLVAAKLLDEVGRYTIEMPVYQILYQALPLSRRLRVQAVRESIVEPIGIGLCGVGIYCFHSLLGLSPTQVLYITFFLACGWMFMSIMLRREYTVRMSGAIASRRLKGADLPLHESFVQTALVKGLKSEKAGQVLYCLDLLEKSGYSGVPSALTGLLHNGHSLIREEALRRIERLGLTEILAEVRTRLAVDENPQVRGHALRAVCALGDTELAIAHLDELDLRVRSGALIGLLRYGGVDGIIAGGPEFNRLVSSGDPAGRSAAAEILGEIGIASFHRPVIRLLEDQDVQVRRAAIATAGKLRSQPAIPLLLAALGTPRLQSSAMSALLAFGPSILQVAGGSMGDRLLDRKIRIWLIRICGKLRLREGCQLLEQHLDDPDPIVRAQIVQSLASCPESLRTRDVRRVAALIDQEMEAAAAILATLADLGDGRFELVHRALSDELELRVDRILRLLSLLYPPELINGARKNLRSGSSAGRARAIEVLDNVLSKDIKSAIWPLIDDIPESESLAALTLRHPQSRRSAEARLEQIVANSPAILSGWTRACAVYVALEDNKRNWAELLWNAASDLEPVVRETAEWNRSPGGQRRNVLLTIEKVIILKTVGIFSEIPEMALVEIAPSLEEVQVAAGEQIIRKGDAGTSLYIVVNGRVRVHDEDRLVATLGDGEVFGEMAVLDPEPRMASVSALEDTLLLRMDGSALDDLMTEYDEIARGIVRMLCRRLRAVGSK